MPVVRRDGRRFRRFDPLTARMSPWFSDAPAKPAAPLVAPQASPVKPKAETLARMSKAELQELASNRKPAIPFNTKTTKAALIEALTA
jgi:hypothetical protein